MPGAPVSTISRAGAAARPSPALAQPRELALAPDQRRRAARVELARQLDGRRLELERGVLAQDRLMQPPQLRAGLDADLVDQRAAGLAKGLERLRLAPAAVQREHQLRRAGARAAGARRRAPRARPTRSAWRPSGQVGVDALLERHAAQLLQPCDLGLRERLVATSASGGPRHSASASRSARGRLGRPIVASAPPRSPTSRSKRSTIELAVVDPQRVSVAAGLQPPPVAIAERPTQLADVVLEHLGGRRRRRLSPQRVDQSLARDRLVAMQQQQDQDVALPAQSEPDGPIPFADLERSQQGKLHGFDLLVTP